MGSGGVAIAALPTVIYLEVPFSDGLGGGWTRTTELIFLFAGIVFFFIFFNTLCPL